MYLVIARGATIFKVNTLLLVKYIKIASRIKIRMHKHRLASLQSRRRIGYLGIYLISFARGY